MLVQRVLSRCSWVCSSSKLFLSSSRSFLLLISMLESRYRLLLLNAIHTPFPTDLALACSHQCCTEYPAYAAAASRVCRESHRFHLDASALRKAVNTAQSVMDQVCYNDCGDDIPCLDEEPQPVNGQDAVGNCQSRALWEGGHCTGASVSARAQVEMARAHAKDHGQVESAVIVDEGI